MIAIGSDNGGFELKGHIIEHLKEKCIEVKKPYMRFRHPGTTYQ